MNLKALIGAGDRIALVTLPFVAAGFAANAAWPGLFAVGAGTAATVAGGVLVAVGVPLWLTSVGQILLFAPRGRLITGGPFRLVLHPIYTSVALLVIPGVGLLLGSWLGPALGAVLYGASRWLAPREERELAARFPHEYPAYRRSVLLPWL